MNSSALDALSEQPRRLVEETEVGLDLPGRRRSLHLDGDLLPVRQHRAVHLADRRRRERREVELEERPLERQVELGLDDLADLLEGNGETASWSPRSSATMSGGMTSGRVERSWPNLTNVGPSSSSISRSRRPRSDAVAEGVAVGARGEVAEAVSAQEVAEAVPRGDLRDLRKAAEVARRPLRVAMRGIVGRGACCGLALDARSSSFSRCSSCATRSSRSLTASRDATPSSAASACSGVSRRSRRAGAASRRQLSRTSAMRRANLVPLDAEPRASSVRELVCALARRGRLRRPRRGSSVSSGLRSLAGIGHAARVRAAAAGARASTTVAPARPAAQRVRAASRRLPRRRLDRPSPSPSCRDLLGLRGSVPPTVAMPSSAPRSSRRRANSGSRCLSMASERRGEEDRGVRARTDADEEREREVLQRVAAEARTARRPEAA